jgi:HEAT repeat protein
MKDPDEAVRLNAVSFRATEVWAPQLIPSLLAALDDPSAAVADAAVKSLACLGPAAQEALPVLQEKQAAAKSKAATAKAKAIGKAIRKISRTAS